MGEVLLLLVVALTVAAVVFGVTVLVSGRDPGLVPAEPDGRAVPLPGTRPLEEPDIAQVRFDTALRGYRMAQVDQAMRRAAYDIGYKSELIGVLEAEVAALREGRTADAEALRRAREEAAGTRPESTAAAPAEAAGDTAATGSDASAGPIPDADAEADAAGGSAAAGQPAAGGEGGTANGPTEPTGTDREVNLRPPADPTFAADVPATDPVVTTAPEASISRPADNGGTAAKASTSRPADHAGTAPGLRTVDGDGDDRVREHGAVVRSESA